MVNKKSVKGRPIGRSLMSLGRRAYMYVDSRK